MTADRVGARRFGADAMPQEVKLVVAGSEELAVARRLLRAQLEDVMAADALDEVILVANELLSLSLEANTATVTLEAVFAGTNVELAAVDGSELRPVVRDSPLATRTLMLVDRLASSWGVERTAGRRRVWACVRNPG